MNCTKAGPTQSNPRVTDKVCTATLLIAHYSRVNIPTRPPPPVLPGIRPSAPYVGVHPLPSLFLFSHHAPEYSISKRGITLSRAPQISKREIHSRLLFILKAFSSFNHFTIPYLITSRVKLLSLLILWRRAITLLRPVIISVTDRFRQNQELLKDSVAGIEFPPEN